MEVSSHTKLKFYAQKYEVPARRNLFYFFALEFEIILGGCYSGRYSKVLHPFLIPLCKGKKNWHS
jgi:hypothetical protein